MIINKTQTKHENKSENIQNNSNKIYTTKATTYTEAKTNIQNNNNIQKNNDNHESTQTNKY